MNHKERQLQILNLLNEEKEVSVEDLAKKFNVSASTIRRELNSMNKLGLIIRTHGGALVQVNKNDEILDHTKRKFHNYHEKMEIAKKAASYIKDNEFVFLHSSSITDLMPPFLTAKNITVATNSLNIAKSLTEADDCQLLLIGGLYYKYAEAIEGTMTVEQIHSMHFQKAFLGANGPLHWLPESISESAWNESAPRSLSLQWLLHIYSKSRLKGSAGSHRCC